MIRVLALLVLAGLLIGVAAAAALSALFTGIAGSLT